MISFTVLKSAADAKRYYAPHGHDYWIEDKEHQAFFGGKLADRLGLKEFSVESFHDLCDGVLPGTRTKQLPDGENLTPGRRDTRRAGWDITVDGPKDLGVLMALGLDDRIIPEVLERAGRDVMALIERDAMTRVRIGKKDTDRPSGNLAYTGILHTTSRPVGDKIDVQPHYHFIVANATWDPVEKRLKALQLQPFAGNGAKESRPYYTAYFNAQLARYMQESGYEVERAKDSFRVVGVPERVRKEFSQRTNLIESVAAKLEAGKQAFLGDPTATLSPEVKGRLGAHTRQKKKPGRTWDSLLTHWNDRITDAERKEILETVTRSHRDPMAMELGNAEALDWALRHSLERASVVTERELITTALKHGLGSVTPEGLYEELGTRQDLIRRSMDGRNLVSTRWVLNEEKTILRFAQDGRGKYRPMGNAGAKVPETLVPGEVKPPSPTQAGMMRHIWSSRDRLLLVRGLAGVGKTETLKATLDQVAIPYVALAPTAEASRGQLRKAGMPDAETLAAFLSSSEIRDKARNGLIVLDEASLAGSHDVFKLLGFADQLNARVLLMGDRRQHKSVARGDVLALLEDRAGLPVAEVSEIRRQSGEYKEAVQMAAKGNVAAAVKKLDSLGWVQENQSADLGKMVADEYVAGLNAGKSMLVVSPTHAEGDRVTAAIRERLKKEGKLDAKDERIETLENANLTEAEKADAETLRAHAGETAQFVRHGLARAGSRVTITDVNAAELAKQGSRFVVYKTHERDLAKGDLLRVTSGIKDTDGKRIDNGSMLTYLGLDNGKLRVESASGAKRLLNPNVGHISFGYVTTSHAAQGRTVDRVLIHAPTASFGAVDKATGYVALSRGKESARIFTDDRQALFEALERDRPRMLASELVRRPRNRVREKLRRHVAFLRELGNEIGRRAREVVRHRDREMAHER